VKPLALLLALLAFPVYAEDWTVDGKDYHNVTVGEVEADRVHITYDGGLGTVPLADLPPDLQKRFGYDPAKAKSEAGAREKSRLAAAADAQANVASAQASLPSPASSTKLVGPGGIDVRQMHASGVPVPSLYVQVLQVLPNGILADLWSYPTDGRYIDFHAGVGAYVSTGKTIFVQCNSSALAQDEMYSANATRNGTFTYQDVTGASRTVEKFVVASN